ncbi:uncharacterized protein ARMOST_17953 [Armillaria ostoyae]|uniref:Uncharacterized protein n=1 Tax=Armillaria ostoyae TaxID=47428 RepID=A0A284S0H2_ARMOS|nr:uncharacterized protein ARMOST_17953 [Armillaria ostoyae]
MHASRACRSVLQMTYEPAIPSVLSKDWVPEMSSHVFLACGKYQFANKVSGGEQFHKLFTQSLINRSWPGDTRLRKLD